MNNKKRISRESLLDKKGFYAALYSCIAVILVVAVGITYSSLVETDGPPAGQEIAQIPEISTGNGELSDNYASQPGVSVARGIASDILPDEGISEVPLNQNGAGSDVQGNAVTESFDTVPVLASPLKPIDLSAESTDESSPGESTATDAAPADNAAAQEVQSEDAAVSSAGSQGGLIPDNSEGYIDSSLADPVFSTYTGNEDMLWPVAGEIIMEFSIDRLVYDKTLDQYRTNDNICIAAKVGEQVKSAADGVVKNIGHSREMGNTIEIEHGNGWSTTYSQLQDGILVSLGDVVTEGQVIGGVGEPSIYSTLLGSHLSFKVTRDDESVDPNLVLALN